MLFATRGSIGHGEGSSYPRGSYPRDGQGLLKFLARVAGAAEHVEKLARGQHDAAGATPDEPHRVYVPDDHDAGGKVDAGREGGRA